MTLNDTKILLSKLFVRYPVVKPACVNAAEDSRLPVFPIFLLYFEGTSPFSRVFFHIHHIRMIYMLHFNRLEIKTV